MKIFEAQLGEPDVVQLLNYHHREMLAGSPAGMAFALDGEGIARADITLFAAREDGRLLGVAALKALPGRSGEIKSMRTAPEVLRQGVARALLEHLIAVARARHYGLLSLETGTGNLFEAAIALYVSAGFLPGEPFAGYEPNGFNRFYHLSL